MNEKYPLITMEDVNKQKIKRHLCSDGKQLFIRIPKKISGFLNLKNRQDVTLLIDFYNQSILITFEKTITTKNKKRSNLNKNNVE